MRPRLILVNGPPGIGKSTLARRYALDHPLALVLDIDDLRTAMGQWETHDESMRLARLLAVEMAQTHLGSGHDVVVPQFLGRYEFVKTLRSVAARCRAAFHEIVLVAPLEDAFTRLTARRKELLAAEAAHPLRLATYDSATLQTIIDELSSIAGVRRKATLIETKTGDIEGAYELMRAAISRPTRPRLPARRGG